LLISICRYKVVDMKTTTRALRDLTLLEQGTGRPTLLLHGGGGPASVLAFADRLDGRVLVPTHPGFDGTSRPDAIASIGDLADLYVDLLEAHDLEDVLVIGNSVGGWIAAELALRDSPRVGAVVLVDAVGLVVPGHPVTDVFALQPSQIADFSYADPDRFRMDPASMPPEAMARVAANFAALERYAGRAMGDPTLAGRLAGVRTPTLVVWGEADRIVDPAYGRAFAAAIPGARFELLAATGHLPQLETPDALAAAIRAFVEG
jgi:pimeloyl-ACP methyl ester carboxylesterase